MEQGMPPEQICEEIMTECLSPDLLMTGTDNMTIVLICFLHNKSYEDFCKRASDYCRLLFADDEKYNEKLAAAAAAKSEQNGVTDDEENASSGDNAKESNDLNGDVDENLEKTRPMTDDSDNTTVTENGEGSAENVESAQQGSDESMEDDTKVEQESKKFKEIENSEIETDLK